MELLAKFFGKRKATQPKTIADYQREALVRLGKEQFQKILELGLVAPVELA